MKLTFRAITSLEEALEHAPLLDRCAAQSLAEFRDDPLPDDVAARFLCTHFDDRECLLLVAEREGGGLEGVCVTGPMRDPLTDEVVPMVLILWVEPDVRHRGVARTLVEQAYARLQKRGARSLAARAGHNDDALISMGERWGFVRQWEHMLIEG